MTDFSNFVTIFVIFKICGHSTVESSPDAVNFPGSDNYGSISPCPRGQNYCDKIEDYPRNVYIDDRLLSNKLIKQKIFDDKFIQPRFSVSTRFGGEKRACAIRRDVVYPKKARNSKGQFVFVVNDNNYRQAVEIEQCVEEGQKCLTDDDAPVSRQTLCKQKYATYKLYAITSNREQVYDSFSLPSACLCHYKSPTSFRTGIQTRARANLPFCKAGTKLNLKDSNALTQQNQLQVSRPSLENQGTQASSSGGQPSISGRQPSNSGRQPSNSGRQSFNSGRQSSPTNFQNNGFPPTSTGQGDQINRGSSQNERSRRNQRRRRRRNHQTRNPTRYSQNQNRQYRWQRDTRKARAFTECDKAKSSFCESPRRYPKNVLSIIMANAQVSGVVYKQVFDSQCTNNIATRGFAIDEDQLCSGIQRVIFPREAKNMDDKWRFVVNIDNFTQSIEIEECDDSFTFSQGSGDEFGDCLYSGSQGNNPDFTTCKQIYTEHKLLALTEAGQLEVDRFMLPSACACYVQTSFSLQQF